MTKRVQLGVSMKRGFTNIGKKLSQVKAPSLPLVSRTHIVILWVVGAAVVIGVLIALSLNHPFPLLQTRGEVANRQRDLLLFATALALLVLVPVYFMIFTFAWRYRAGHKKEYKPDWDTHKGYEALWWGIPIAIISVLAVVTWTTSHSLDPFKPLASSQKPLQVQVVALQWKWLFIYPEEGVASVNEVAFPAGRPVEFTMTSDAPMNSFWIPQLAGQIYVMSGMSTKLHVSADITGVYEGMSSNISGKGFADMKFKARAMTVRDFDAWVEHARATGEHLTQASYEVLAMPKISAVAYYHVHDQNIYDDVIMKYMHGMSPNEVKPTEEKVPSQMDSGHMEHHMEGMHQ